MKKLLFAFIFVILLIGTLSAADWDNKKSYIEETETVTITNSFLGMFETSDVAEITLNTPKINYVIRGEDRLVAEFTINNFAENYPKAFKKMSFYNVNNGMEEFEREFTYKYKDKGEWIILDTAKDLKKGELTVGVFTDVLPGETVEWIPELFGVEINEWAVWTESLNINLTAYYALDRYSGDVIDSNNFQNGTNFGANRGEIGILNNSFDFEADDNNTVNLSTALLPIGVDDDYSINAWIKIETLTNPTNSYLSQYVSGETGRSLTGTIRDNGSVQFGTFAGNVFSSATIGTGVWHMITLIANGTNKSIYINGSFDNSRVISTLVGNFPTVIGGTADNVSALDYDGLVDELGIWNRSLSTVEITQLWNGSTGITFIGDFEMNVSVELTSPANNTNTLNTTIFLRSNSTVVNDGNLTNTTLYLWYPNDTLVGTNTTIITGTIFNTTTSTLTSSFVDSGYHWNYLTCVSNSTGTVSCAFSTTNRTINIVPFSENSEVFNIGVFETDKEYFEINISTLANVDNIGAFLHYNGTAYAAVHSCANDICNISRTIDIPLLANQSLPSENKTFFWQITFFGSGLDSVTANTTSDEQNVTGISFDSCGTSPVAVNFTINNESTNDLTISDFKGTFSYYIGEGSVIEQINLSSSGTNGYDFCIDQNETFITTSEIEIQNGTLQRDYFFRRIEYTNSTTTQKLYLPGIDASEIIIEVKDQGLIPKPNILVNISRFYPDINKYEQVESQLTDEFGQFVAKLVESDVKYLFTFSNPSGVIIKTSDKITVACRTAICVLPFVLEDTEDFLDRFDIDALITSSLIFDNTTNIFGFSWDDQTQESARFRLEVTRFNLNSSTIVCNTTSTSKLSTLTCDVGGEDASYKAQSFRFVIGSIEKRISLLNIKVGGAVSTYGIEGLFWVFILLFTLVGIGAFNPTVGASLYGIGFVIFGIMGVISMPLPVFFANSVLVAVFIWAVNT